MSDRMQKITDESEVSTTELARQCWACLPGGCSRWRRRHDANLP